MGIHSTVMRIVCTLLLAILVHGQSWKKTPTLKAKNYCLVINGKFDRNGKMFSFPGDEEKALRMSKVLKTQRTFGLKDEIVAFFTYKTESDIAFIDQNLDNVTMITSTTKKTRNFGFSVSSEKVPNKFKFIANSAKDISYQR